MMIVITAGRSRDRPRIRPEFYATNAPRLLRPVGYPDPWFGGDGGGISGRPPQTQRPS